MFFAYRLDVREAAQRVSFVNQVSHELKTPLTNIRLYVDLARDASPATRFVMVSACSETRDIVTAIRRGACDYVTKPFEPEDLCRLIAKTLGVKQ